MQPYKLSKTPAKTFTFSALNVGTYEGGITFAACS